jgi:hypothetical protein
LKELEKSVTGKKENGRWQGGSNNHNQAF